MFKYRGEKEATIDIAKDAAMDNDEFWRKGGWALKGVLHPFTSQEMAHPELAKRLGLGKSQGEVMGKGAIRVTPDWVSRAGMSRTDRIYLEMQHLGQKDEVISLLRDHPPPEGIPLTLEWGGYMKRYEEFGSAEEAVEWLENLGIGGMASEKIAALRSIWYHGSSIKNLRSIVAQGLIPDPKERNWADDPDASIGNPSRASYGGIYVTRNLMTATSAPKDCRPRAGRSSYV